MLGSMAEKAVSRSVEALRLRDVNLARSVIEDDRKIVDYSYELEEQALLLTATQQPLATDLWTIAASNFIVAELERIADYAEGIAKITLSVAKDPPVKPLSDIPKMATVATSMLHSSLTAFIDGDLAACRAIWH
jgi:phosphate transport system protein